MKQKLFFIVILSGISLFACSQEYNGAIGIRGGVASGFTYRRFFDHEIALETILSFRKGGVQVTLLRETHRPTLLEFSDNMLLAFGFGGHVGFSYTDHHNFMFDKYYFDEKKFLPLIGLDGYVGMEYICRKVPLAISLDCKPFFEANIKGMVQLNPFDVGFTIKYWF